MVYLAPCSYTPIISSNEFDDPVWPPWAPAPIYIYIHINTGMDRHTHTHVKKICF